MGAQDQLNSFDDLERKLSKLERESNKYRELYLELLEKEIDVMELLVNQSKHFQKHLKKPIVFRALLGKVLREKELEGGVSDDLIIEIEQTLRKY